MMESATISEDGTGVLEFDAEWEDFLKEMEASEADGLGNVDSRIDYYLEKIREGRAQMVKNSEVANRRLAMIVDWEQGEAAKIERRNTYLVGQIGMIAPSDEFKMKAEYGKKSRDLPHGTFGWRQKPDTVEIEDMVLAVLFARTQNLPVKTVRTVSKTDLKKYVKETGESEGEGWRNVEGQSELFVKPAK